MEYGYIRGSTKEQNEDRQRIALEQAGVRNVVLDKCSGKDFDRPGYRRLCRKLKPGDTLYIKASTGWVEIITRFWSSGGI